jgi:TPP-dependent 2-oxoacid decarboxylase
MRRAPQHGYAADGYAKVHCLGAVSVSYGVGTLSLANAIADARRVNRSCTSQP